MMRRRQLLRALAAAPAFGSAAWARTDAAVHDETWSDGGRRRDVPVRIRWPVGAAPAGGLPLVLFSHGLGGNLDGGTAWGEAWAAAGFIVLHVQHAGSDTPAVRAAFANGGLARVASAEQLVERVRDIRFVIDEVLRRRTASLPGWAAVRPDAIGMSGHSFGAHTTLAIAGQRLPGHRLADTRPASFIAFSPTLPSYGSPESLLADVRRPLLCLTGTRDADVIGTGATPDRRAAVFDALPAGAKARLVLADADHMTFAGQPGRTLLRRRDDRAASQLEPAHTALLAALTTDWWRATLLNDPDAARRLQQPAGLAPGDRWDRG